MVLLAGYAVIVEPTWLQVRRVEIPLDHLPPGFAGYRIAFVSDFHLDDGTPEDFLAGLARLINDQQPDVVLLGGDYFSADPARYRAMLIQAVRQIDAPDGVLAVLGNHDHWRGADEVRAVLSESGARTLENQVIRIERGSEQLYLAGLGDVWEQADRLDLLSQQIPENAAAVLLVHEPDIADQAAATGKFGLQLSGHSHGGQVNLPFIGPPIRPNLGERYPIGLQRAGGLPVYTTRGIGMTALAVRFNCRPEVTVIDLVSAP